MSRIINIPTAKIADIIAGLVRQGITFEVHPNTDEGELWSITFIYKGVPA